MSPRSSVAVVPDTQTKGPTRTAREYPTIGSQRVPEPMFVRCIHSGKRGGRDKGSLRPDVWRRGHGLRDGGRTLLGGGPRHPLLRFGRLLRVRLGGGLRLPRLRARDLGLLLLARGLRLRALELLRALHVHAQDPGRAPAHDDLDDRVRTPVASFRRREDEAPLRERVRVVALRVAHAPEEALPASGMADDHLALLALLAPPDDVLTPEAGTLRVDAERLRLPAPDPLDRRGAALRALLLRRLDEPRRERMVHLARRVVRASDEARAAPRRADEQVAAVLRAHADEVLDLERARDLRADRVLVLDEHRQGVVEEGLGFVHDLRLRPDPAGDPVHVRLEVRGHLRLRDLLRVVLEGGDERASRERRLQLAPLDVLPVVQLLDDLVARRLRPEVQAVHLLDQGALREPRDEVD